ncbi:MAG: hypothetical protein AAGI27_07215 [Pseudomonadota bacterium]
MSTIKIDAKVIILVPAAETKRDHSWFSPLLLRRYEIITDSVC